MPNKNIALGLVSLGVAAALVGCGASGDGGGAALASAPVPNGPAADYPIVVGNPYIIAGVTYTPADVWNYDEVGYVSVDSAGGNTISGANHVLPLPSYAEVTSLETGRTILVRIERRGPMGSHDVVALSPGAAQQLGVADGTPVRVRRVNPQEPERAALRAGKPAPDRMDTPMSLVNVLKLKLPNGGPPASLALPKELPSAGVDVPPKLANAGPPVPAPVQPAPVAVAPKPAPQVAARPPAVQVAPKPPAAKPPAAKPATRGFVVQAGAFSTKDRADKVAKALGGQVSKSGSLYRVRTGPFPTRNAADASLAKVKAAGYSDARIYSEG
ncbi:MAG TPA: SPOR domain-containing protein [Devosia sp.]|nr:SPOR domain-containing protein [Devosia sp.]